MYTFSFPIRSFAFLIENLQKRLKWKSFFEALAEKKIGMESATIPFFVSSA
jgi:hypothetical protein